MHCRIFIRVFLVIFKLQIANSSSSESSKNEVNRTTVPYINTPPIMDSIAAGVLMTWECCKTNENPNPDISKNADKNFPKSTTYVEVSLIKSSLDHLLQKTIGRCATSSINADIIGNQLLYKVLPRITSKNPIASTNDNAIIFDNGFPNSFGILINNL